MLFPTQLISYTTILTRQVLLLAVLWENGKHWTTSWLFHLTSYINYINRLRRLAVAGFIDWYFWLCWVTPYYVDLHFHYQFYHAESSRVVLEMNHLWSRSKAHPTCLQVVTSHLSDHGQPFSLPLPLKQVCVCCAVRLHSCLETREKSVFKSLQELSSQYFCSF